MSKDPTNESLQGQFLNLLHARQGHFKLESGHHGSLWLDLDRFFARPKELQRFVINLAHKISAFEIDAVCGPMVGGALIAYSIALELGVDYLYTERTAPQNADSLYSASYHLPNPLRAAVSGRNVAVVDDVINAASAIRGTLIELESLAARPVVIGALLILGETGRRYFAERNLPLRYLTQLANEIWAPEDCPFCASQIPFDKPT